MLYDKKKYSLTCGGKEIALETCWVTICHALASHCVTSRAASPSDVVQPQCNVTRHALQLQLDIDWFDSLIIHTHLGLIVVVF